MEFRAVCTFFKPFPLTNKDIDGTIVDPSKAYDLPLIAKKGIFGPEIVKGELKNCFSEIPEEIRTLIFKLYPAKINRLDEVCKVWRVVSESIYLSENQQLQYLTFCNKNLLSQKMVFTINERVKIFASMARNIFHNIHRNEAYRIRFEALWKRFNELLPDKYIFLPRNNCLTNFINYVYLDIENKFPSTQHNVPTQYNVVTQGKTYETKFLEETDIAIEFASKRDDITDLQNRIILRFYKRKFTYIHDSNYNNDQLFLRLKSTHVDLINNHAALTTLRKISIENRTSENWEKILELDPGRSIDDLRQAAECFYASKNYKRAAECRMQVLCEGSADTRLHDLRLATIACSTAGFKSEVLCYNEQILKLAGVKATEIDLRHSAIGCENAGLYMEASAYWLMYSDKFVCGLKREDLDLMKTAFDKAGFSRVSHNIVSKVEIGSFIATEQAFRDLAVVCNKFDMKKHFADCWKEIIALVDEKATLEDLRTTGLACTVAKLYTDVVKYMGLVVEKSGKEVLESDLRIYAEACLNVDFNMAYDAWKKVIEKVGGAATMYDIRQIAILCTNLNFDVEAVKYWEILLNNTVEVVTALELMSIAQAYEKVKSYDQAIECLK